MKYLIVGVVLATVCIQAISALKCMQGIEVKADNSNGVQKNEKPLDIEECGAGTTLASAALLFTAKPSSISFPSGDYKCYHLKYNQKNSELSTIIKGCIYKSLDVCDGKFSSDNVQESFCSQCDMDACNSAGRYGFDLKLLGLTLVAIVTYLLK
ncbi:uncharacterized protein LOC135699681 [Ochlerotatus camptorhynchus]|uniref:uncharacterized protein LOC135699681 n=1 Tax=Ochlerotatus camptorhynchus TaxID=644619 RepID=UPI0031D2655B